MRYTEGRMTRLSSEMLDDLDKDTVDFVPNWWFTGTTLCITFQSPQPLLNGSSGIAVGMATNMPPHNIRGGSWRHHTQLDNPEITIQELMKYIKALTFPTGGTIYGTEGIRETYETGRGRIILRGKTEISTWTWSDCNYWDSLPVVQICIGAKINYEYRENRRHLWCQWSVGSRVGDELKVRIVITPRKMPSRKSC